MNMQDWWYREMGTRALELSVDKWELIFIALSNSGNDQFLDLAQKLKEELDVITEGE